MNSSFPGKITVNNLVCIFTNLLLGTYKYLSTYILQKKNQTNPIGFYYTYYSATFFFPLNNIAYTWGKGIQPEWGLLKSILKIPTREVVPIYIPQQQPIKLPVSLHAHSFQCLLHYTAMPSFVLTPCYW